MLTNINIQIVNEDIFKSIKSILSFDEKFHFNFETITTDIEQALINGVSKYCPESHRISCYFHYKKLLERNSKKRVLKKMY